MITQPTRRGFLIGTAAIAYIVDVGHRLPRVADRWIETAPPMNLAMRTHGLRRLRSPLVLLHARIQPELHGDGFGVMRFAAQRYPLDGWDLMPWVGGRHIDFEQLEPFLDLATRSGVRIVVVHLPPTDVDVARDLDRMVRGFPDLAFVVLDARPDVASACRDARNIWLDIGAALDRGVAVEAFQPCRTDRLLWGTGGASPTRVRRMVAAIRVLPGLDEATRARILGENAAILYSARTS
jgi:predicted TIM-barrel fold metal-dependent hydrolase